MMMRKCKAVAWKIFLWFFDRRLREPNDNEFKQLTQLRNIFLTLPDADETVSSEAERAWNRNLNCLKYKVINTDAREFLRWDVVRGTMFVGNAKYINDELAYLKANKEWISRWRIAIRESEQGCPPPYYGRMESSSNLIHHAYHLARFEEETGLKINELKNIFEFGGGYGSMCRLVHQLGFKGKYVIFDLPHFSHLQKFYLKSLGLNVKEKEGFDDVSGIYCLDELEDIERVRVGGCDSLFIATWSFSETPISIRERLLAQIELSQSCLIAYQDVFGEVDNVSYFSITPEFKTFPNLLNEKIAHLPGSRYLFGSSYHAGFIPTSPRADK